MPKDVKWRMRYMNQKNVIECKKLHLIRRPHSKVHVQSWIFVSYCGTNVQRHV